MKSATNGPLERGAVKLHQRLQDHGRHQHGQADWAIDKVAGVGLGDQHGPAQVRLKQRTEDAALQQRSRLTFRLAESITQQAEARSQDQIEDAVVRAVDAPRSTPTGLSGEMGALHDAIFLRGHEALLS